MLTPAEKLMGQHVAEIDTPTQGMGPETADERIARQRQNLTEWQKSYQSATSDKQREILRNELHGNIGIDFPDHVGQGMEFNILGKDAQPQNPSMEFNILGKGASQQMPQAVPETSGTSTPATGPSGPYAFGSTPGGAASRTLPRPTNYTGSNPEIDGPATARFATEGAATALGGMAGGALGGLTRSPALTTAGIRAGETAGAFGGSLLSEIFDPSQHPLSEAAKTAGMVLGTGLAVDSGLGIARRLIGKPHEAGQALMDIMAAKGQVPLPGAVLESEFIRNTQSFGSAAYGTNELLKKAQASMEGITSDAVRGYISGFQRYHEGAKTLFKQVDEALAGSLPTSTQAVVGGAPMGWTGSASMRVGAPGARFFLKGDAAARDAVLDVAKNWVNRTGRADAMPDGLQKMYAWAQNPTGPAPKMTFSDTQEIYDALFNKARILDQAAKNKDVSEVAGTNTAAYIRQQAVRVKQAFDQQLDAAINSKIVDADTKVKLQAARQNWTMWTQGQEVERMVAQATKDAAGDGVVSGTKLMAQIDKMMKEDMAVSKRPYVSLSKDVTENLRRYALAAQAVEQSGKQGAFVLAGRAGQLIGLMSATGAFAAGAGGVGALLSFPLLAPHVIAATFANPRASALLIRGLKVAPGSEAALRIARELGTIWERENLVGRDYSNPDMPGVNGAPVHFKMDEDLVPAGTGGTRG